MQLFALLWAAAAVVRRDALQDLEVTVGAQAELSLGGELLETCKRLAEQYFSEKGSDAHFVKSLGGAGSGGAVFLTSANTVIKCGTGDNMEFEGKALSALRRLDGVVDLLGVTNLEGHWLLELEFISGALTWRDCFSKRQECVDPAGDACSGGECFSRCATDQRQGEPLFAEPLTYASARGLAVDAIRAFGNVCQAGWTQYDARTGMNTMVTAAKAVKLIDFEKGHPLGDHSGRVWCAKDLYTIGQRIEELTECLAEDDPFRTEMRTIGAEIAEWKGTTGKKAWPRGAEPADGVEQEQWRAAAAAARAADIAETTAKMNEFLAAIAALP